jgi:hypothetical protein
LPIAPVGLVGLEHVVSRPGTGIAKALENAAQRPTLDEGVSNIEASPLHCDVDIRIDDPGAGSAM